MNQDTFNFANNFSIAGQDSNGNIIPATLAMRVIAAIYGLSKNHRRAFPVRENRTYPQLYLFGYSHSQIEKFLIKNKICGGRISEGQLIVSKIHSKNGKIQHRGKPIKIFQNEQMIRDIAYGLGYNPNNKDFADAGLVNLRSALPSESDNIDTIRNWVQDKLRTEAERKLILQEQQMDQLREQLQALQQQVQTNTTNIDINRNEIEINRINIIRIVNKINQSEDYIRLRINRIIEMLEQGYRVYNGNHEIQISEIQNTQLNTMTVSRVQR